MEKMENFKTHKFLLALLIFVIFFIQGYIGLDPDFGWHLRLGQIILSSGIPKTDSFSYTMPSFPAVDHEWLSNICLSWLYFHIGYLGLAILFSLFIFLTLWLMFYSKNPTKYSLVPLFLSAGVLTNFSGIRVQVISWVFLAALLKVILDDNLWQKLKWFLPFFFLVWANLHPGFVAGLAVLGLVTLVRTIEQRKLFLNNWIIFTVSTLATLINPYGIRLWGEEWLEITDTSLHSKILEWTPGFYFVDFAFLTLFTLSAFLTFYLIKNRILFKHASINWKNLAVFLLLFLATLDAVRNAPLWVISAGPFLVLLFKSFEQKFAQDNFFQKSWPKVYKILTVSTLILFLLEGGLGIWDAYKFNESFPKPAVTFLKSEHLAGNIFSTYGWGGYLDWKLSNKKVFIDGRMPSWRRDSAPKGESLNAFNDYSLITTNQNSAKKLLNQYQIEYILWPSPNQNPNLPEKISQWYFETVNNLAHSPKQPSFPEIIQNLGWKKIYQDKTTVIYKRIT